jgi:hypothetical protein
MEVTDVNRSGKSLIGGYMANVPVLYIYFAFICSDIEKLSSTSPASGSDIYVSHVDPFPFSYMNNYL